MAQHAIETTGESTTEPVRLIWQRDGNEAKPALTIDEGPLRTHLFAHFEVDSIEALAEHVLSASQRQRSQSVRLGVGVQTGEDATYLSEAVLLARVEGIDASLAGHLVEWVGDIPSLCEERRRQGEVMLGDLLHDAQVEDRAWTNELETFIDGLGHGETLEQRLKDAGVWVEPDTVAAGVEQ